MEHHGYRLRMIHNQWYLVLCKDGKATGEAHGPMTYKEAVDMAPTLGLQDEDKRGS